MKILLASDGSSNAIDAANFIAGLAATNDVEVHLIQVLANENDLVDSMSPWMPVWCPNGNQDRPQQLSQCNVEALAMLSRCCRSVSMSYPRGDACMCILQEAKTRDVDLIAMGAHGHSMLERVLLGSVSEHVAHHANCSVIVVRGTEQASDRQPPKAILVGYDRSRGAYEAVQEMLKATWSCDTQVNLLSVAPIDLPFQSSVRAEAESEAVCRLRSTSENLTKTIRMSIPKTTYQVLQSSHAGNAIVRTAEETGSDLILLGETGKGAIKRWVLGSTTSYVLRHAPCSVWVSRFHRKRIPTASFKSKSSVAQTLGSGE